MMKNILFFCVTILTFSFSIIPANADDKIDHYEAQIFDNKKEALKALKETSRKMAHIAAADNLDVAQMEEIHQISYTTENAVAFLNKKSKLDRLAERLEAVHKASENHKALSLRQNYILYQAELMHYLASK